jgi:small subunit ribosomal protein S21
VTTVKLKNGESQEALLRRFRKKVVKSRILSTVKKKRYYISPSEERRIAKRKGIRRARKREARNRY